MEKIGDTNIPQYDWNDSTGPLNTYNLCLINRKEQQPLSQSDAFSGKKSQETRFIFVLFEHARNFFFFLNWVLLFDGFYGVIILAKRGEGWGGKMIYWYLWLVDQFRHVLIRVWGYSVERSMHYIDFSVQSSL